ncbi:Hypothetical predicted protein, partial [Drosophila guanche]
EEEEMHVEILSDDSNADGKSSSYGTAGGEGESNASLDGWSAHDQVQDTTMTSSTYYNVSEESDTDDQPNDPLVEAKEGKILQQQQQQQSDKSDESEAVGHTPRTRSRGSVKINLWSLDMSPVASTLNRSGSNKSAKKIESTPRETHSEPRRREAVKRIGNTVDSNTKPVNNKPVNNKPLTQHKNTAGTLHPWITKVPKVMIRSTPLPASAGQSAAAGAASSSSGTTNR